MTDVHSTQIVNITRNSNTTLQGSTLQSSNTTLNKNYNFQSLRTVKGISILPNANGSSSINTSLINEYDWSPISLYPGDIIMSISIYNGNTSFKYPNSYTQTLFGNKFPIPFINGGNLKLAITPEPVYNNISQLWIPDTSNIRELCNMDLYNLAVYGSSGYSDGINTPVSYNTSPSYKSSIGSINNYSSSSYSGNCRWLTCMFTGLTSPIIPNFNFRNQVLDYVRVNVTLVILNPSSV
jgi:hypothetical protein